MGKKKAAKWKNKGHKVEEKKLGRGMKNTSSEIVRCPSGIFSHFPLKYPPIDLTYSVDIPARYLYRDPGHPTCSHHRGILQTQEELRHVSGLCGLVCRPHVIPTYCWISQVTGARVQITFCDQLMMFLNVVQSEGKVAQSYAQGKNIAARVCFSTNLPTNRRISSFLYNPHLPSFACDSKSYSTYHTPSPF